MIKIYIIGCLVILSSLNFLLSDAAPVLKNGYNSPQILPEKDGYVPVYIRVGETPLTDINSKLAEAFQENNTKENKSDTDNLIGPIDTPDNVNEKKTD